MNQLPAPTTGTVSGCAPAAEPDRHVPWAGGAIAAGLLLSLAAGTAEAQLELGRASTVSSPVGLPEANRNFGQAITWADVNADGRDDLLTVYEDPSFDLLRLVVFHSTPAGFVLQPGSVLLNDIEDVALASCDFAGSVPGEEVIVGLPATAGSRGLGSDTGEVRVYTFISGTPTLWDTFTQDDAPGSSAGADERFGAALATGDFNGDSLCDLAVGSPEEDHGGVLDSGAVHVLLSGGGWSSQFGVGDLNPGILVSANDNFGSVLAAGPINPHHASVSLGIDDEVLVIGVPRSDDPAQDAGHVWVLAYDSGESPPFTAQYLNANLLGGTPAVGDAFGASLAVGDLNGDRLFDLAIGLPNAAVDPGLVQSGSVIVVAGGPDGQVLTSTNDLLTVADLGLTPQAGDDFGESLAFGRFLGGLTRDLVVGAPGFANSRGRLGVFRGGPDPLTFEAEAVFPVRPSDLPGEDEGSDRFGFVLAAGDADGDGDGDLAVGSPFEEIEARGSTPGDNLGVVHVIPSRSHLHRAELLAITGETFAGQGPIEFIEDPSSNPAGESVQVMRTTGMVELATTSDLVDDSSADLLERMGLDAAGNRAWMDLAAGTVETSHRGQIFQNGDPAPSGGSFAFSSADDLWLRGDELLFLLTTTTSPATVFSQTDLATSTSTVLLAEGQTVEGFPIDAILRAGVSPNGTHWLAEVESDGDLGYLADGSFFANPSELDPLQIADLAIDDGGETFLTLSGLGLAFIDGGFSGTVLSRNGSVGGISLSAMAPFATTASAFGEVTSVWAPFFNASGLLAVSCPSPGEARGSTPGSGERVAVRLDGLDTDDDGLLDWRIVEFDTDSQSAPQVSADGTIVVRALIERHESAGDLEIALLRMTSPVCPDFADGFETGTTSAWSSSVP